jgi:hypothetical protein
MKRIVLYKEVEVGGNRVWKFVDFGVLSKVSTYERLGYVVVEWVLEAVKSAKEIAERRWDRFRSALERATSVIFGTKTLALALG